MSRFVCSVQFPTGCHGIPIGRRGCGYLLENGAITNESENGIMGCGQLCEGRQELSIMWLYVNNSMCVYVCVQHMGSWVLIVST